MTPNDNLVLHIANLIGHSKDLYYKDHYGAKVRVVIQPLARIERVNADKTNQKKLADAGAGNAMVIGNDELGVPVIISCETLKAYLLDSDSLDPGEYLKHEITMVYE